MARRVKKETKTIGELPKTKEAEVEEKKLEEFERMRKRVYDELLKNNSNVRNLNYAIFNTLDSVLEAEIAFESALYKLSTANSNAFFDFDDTWVKRTHEKLLRVLFLHLVIPSIGLLEYKDQIMEKVLDDFFTSKETKDSNDDIKLDKLLAMLNSKSKRGPNG